MTKVAVVLSGCGVFDGTEIHEAVGALLALSRAGATAACFAPEIDAAVVDHRTQQPTGERRAVLAESARIARGAVAPLDALDPGSFDAVVFPGGFGAAKNLCDFAERGAACEAHPEVARVLRGFAEAGKPIGMCCIAPVLAARVLGTGMGGPGCAVTIGSDPATADAIAAMGGEHVARGVTEVLVDEERRLVTTPAYMCDAPIHEVVDGIAAMVARTLELAAAPAPR